MKLLHFIIALLFALPSFGQYYYKENYPKHHFAEVASPPAPDYAKPDHWAALPTKVDYADMTPKGLEDKQSEAKVDVFFVHPTTYTGKAGMDQWNASVEDMDLNQSTDETTIQYQASIFNGSARVYAPRYRQAHIHVYYTKEEGQEADAEKSLNLAYQDVKSAFLYYLEHFNEGRPFIIASHSQGTTHAGRLLLEELDGKTLQKQMVAAYIVGIPIPKDSLKNIPPCESPEQIGCFCAWRTFVKGYLPPWEKEDANYVVTNPLTWTTDDKPAPDKLNKGGVLKKFNKVRPAVCNAQVCGNVLWIDHPNVFGSKIANIKNYHIADYNLFYMNIRENVALRVKEYLGE